MRQCLRPMLYRRPLSPLLLSFTGLTEGEQGDKGARYLARRVDSAKSRSRFSARAKKTRIDGRSIAHATLGARLLFSTNARRSIPARRADIDNSNRARTRLERPGPSLRLRHLRTRSARQSTFFLMSLKRQSSLTLFFLSCRAGAGAGWRLGR